MRLLLKLILIFSLNFELVVFETTFLVHTNSNFMSILISKEQRWHDINSFDQIFM